MPFSLLPSEDKEQLWFDLKSAAESGWDFSTRWYTQGYEQNNNTLRNTRTSRILPTDLNALLCRTEKTLAAFHQALGEQTVASRPWLRIQPACCGCDRPTWRHVKQPSFRAGDGESAAQYETAAAARLRAIETVLWDADRGAWFDYNLVTQSRHTEFYPSNLAPLWAQCYSQPEMAEKAVQYLKVGGNRHTLLFFFLFFFISVRH